MTSLNHHWGILTFFKTFHIAAGEGDPDTMMWSLFARNLGILVCGLKQKKHWPTWIPSRNSILTSCMFATKNVYYVRTIFKLHYRIWPHCQPSWKLHLCSLQDNGTLWYSRASCLVDPLGNAASARPGRSVYWRGDSFTDFHLLKKIEYKSSFLGNGCTKVGYLFKELYDTIVSNLM